MFITIPFTVNLAKAFKVLYRQLLENMLSGESVPLSEIGLESGLKKTKGCFCISIIYSFFIDSERKQPS